MYLKREKIALYDFTLNDLHIKGINIKMNEFMNMNSMLLS